MKRWIHATTGHSIPLGPYSTREQDRERNNYYWQLRAQETDDMKDIRYFANSPDYWDRYYVCENPNTPKELLRNLMNDPNKHIRSVAELQLSTWEEHGEPYWGKDRRDDYKYYVQNDEGRIYRNYDLSEDNKITVNKQTEKKSPRWPGHSYWDSLLEDDIDFSDAFDEAQNMYLIDTIIDVENELDVFTEGSGFGSSGSIVFSDDSDEDRFKPFSIHVDDLNADVFDIARSSKNKREFRTKYKKYLKNLINQNR